MIGFPFNTTRGTMDSTLKKTARQALRRKPISDAIHIAAAAHPAVVDAPDQLRTSRHAAVTATASAMADADGSEHVEDAAQIVDEAAIALSLHYDRTSPVVLRAAVREHHTDVAARLALVPEAVAAGLDLPESIARVEAALTRARRMRQSFCDDLRAAWSCVLSTLIPTLGARGTPVENLDDADLLQVIEDCLDASLPKEAPGS